MLICKTYYRRGTRLYIIQYFLIHPSIYILTYQLSAVKVRLWNDSVLLQYIIFLFIWDINHNLIIRSLKIHFLSILEKTLSSILRVIVDLCKPLVLLVMKFSVDRYAIFCTELTLTTFSVSTVFLNFSFLRLCYILFVLPEETIFKLCCSSYHISPLMFERKLHILSHFQAYRTTHPNFWLYF